MRHVLWGVLVVACAAALTGCGGGGTSTQSATEKDFEKLYKQYSAKFYEQMTTQEAEAKQPVEITMEAARIWDSVFAAHKDLLRDRAAEILKNLDKAQPLQEDLYQEVSSGVRPEAPPDQPQAVVLKQFLWSPVGAAQMGLNNWLARILNPSSFSLRSVMTANAGLFWEAVDSNLDHPALLLRQGPMIFIVSLTRKDDYYMVDKIRWLRPKAMAGLPPVTGTAGTLPGVTATGATLPPATPTASSPVSVPPKGKEKSTGPKG